jgi:ATP-dependent helicase/nuclease subunit A
LAAAAAAARGSEKTDQPLGLKLQEVAEAVMAGEAPVDEARAIFLTDSGSPRKTVATKAVDTAVCAWLSHEQERLCVAFDQAKSARVGWDTVHALTLAYVYAAEYERAKRTMGVLDFADLIVRAAGC